MNSKTKEQTNLVKQEDVIKLALDMGIGNLKQNEEAEPLLEQGFVLVNTIMNGDVGTSPLIQRVQPNTNRANFEIDEKLLNGSIVVGKDNLFASFDENSGKWLNDNKPVKVHFVPTGVIEVVRQFADKPLRLLNGPMKPFEGSFEDYQKSGKLGKQGYVKSLDVYGVIVLTDEDGNIISSTTGYLNFKKATMPFGRVIQKAITNFKLDLVTTAAGNPDEEYVVPAACELWFELTDQTQSAKEYENTVIYGLKPTLKPKVVPINKETNKQLLINFALSTKKFQRFQEAIEAGQQVVNDDDVFVDEVDDNPQPVGKQGDNRPTIDI